MKSPYVANPSEDIAMAQTALACVMTALVWHRPLRPKLGSFVFALAVWLAAVVPFAAETMIAFSAKPTADSVHHLLYASAACATLAMAIARPHYLVFVAAAGSAGLYALTKHFVAADNEIAATYLIFYGLLYGAHAFMQSRARVRVPQPTNAPRRPSYVRHDLILFVVGTLAAAVACYFVLDRRMNSGDEWADTYQADVFAHAKAYGPVPHCTALFQAYWVFYSQGRAFAQYTPGWPLAMAPFQLVHAAWLAAPAFLGAMGVACARIARRIARAVTLDPKLAPERVIAASGLFAGLLPLAGAGVLLNAASRYPHVFVCACFAWAVESVSVISDRGEDAPSRVRQWAYGLLLGTTTALALSARPSDGATLGVGVFFFFVYVVAARRVGWRAFVATSIAFVFWAGLSLVILRLQLGKWFVTGYSMAYSWATPHYAAPGPTDFRAAFPLGMIAFAWWPCAPAIAAFGFARAFRGAARGPIVTLALSSIALVTLYAMVVFPAGRDVELFGYGTRYQLPLIVPIAIGSGLALGPLWVDARSRGFSGRSAFTRGGPLAITLVAFLVGVARILPTFYPIAFAETRLHYGVIRAAEALHLKNAVVTLRGGEIGFDPKDLLQNYPFDENPDVVYLLDGQPEENACGYELYADRKWYRGTGREEGKLTSFVPPPPTAAR